MRFLIGILALAVTAGVGSAPVFAQGKQAAKEPAGIAAEFLQQWNATGRKLAGMAQDFPEDKLDYKATPVQRTFAEQLLHAAGANYIFIAAATGTKAPADAENPARATYKTRGQLVGYIQKAYADGAKVIQEQGDKGMLEIVKSPFGNLTRAALWSYAIAHANDHYGQCVVYYRLNGLVPPESRPRK